MKKTLILLVASLSLFNSYSQETEEYVDGRLIKTQNKEGVIVTTSLRTIQRNDGKYYTFDVSISNSSEITRNIKIKDFKAQIVSKKGKKKDIDVLTNKDYQKKKKRRGNFRAILGALSAGQNAANAGTSSSQTNTNVNANSYSSGSANVNAYDSRGNSATAQGNYNSRTNTNVNATSTTVSYDGAAAYNAQQNEERKLQEFMQQQQEAKRKWNDLYIKNNTLSPKESMSGLLNVEYKKGVLVELNIVTGGIQFVFKWDPEDSQN